METVQSGNLYAAECSDDGRVSKKAQRRVSLRFRQVRAGFMERMREIFSLFLIEKNEDNAEEKANQRGEQGEMKRPG